MKFSKFVRPTKGGMTYDIEGGDPVLLFPLATMLQKALGLDAGRIPAFGLDGTYIELTKGEIKLTVGWDIWSDIFIKTSEKNGEALFKSIEYFLNKNHEILGELKDNLVNEQKEKEKQEKAEEKKK